jgi:hypothetical protein
LSYSLRYFGHVNKKLTNTENWHEISGAIAVIKLDHVALRLFEIAFRKILEEPGDAD